MNDFLISSRNKNIHLLKLFTCISRQIVAKQGNLGDAGAKLELELAERKLEGRQRHCLP